MNWLNTSHGIWNAPINPFGNYQEPSPVPEHNELAAQESWLPSGLWWWMRNPFTNFCDFWAGILVLDKQGGVVPPQLSGWRIIDVKCSLPSLNGANISMWVRDRSIPRPYFRYDSWFTFYIGWRTSGSFGIALRRN